MGLKLKLEVKNAFLERYHALRVLDHARNLDARRVAVDVSACCRSVLAALEHQNADHKVTASRISRRFFDKYTRNHPEATEFFFAFDSYADMHDIRYKMYTESRYAEASEERLANLKPGEVVARNRVYRYECRPYTQDEVDSWGLHTEIDARRVFNGAPSKQKLYQLMFDEMVRLSCEQLGIEGKRTIILDGIGSHDDPRGVAVVTLEGELLKCVESRPRGAKHGEADQKLAHYFARSPDKGEGCAWYTIDGDAIGQCVCLGLKSQIVFSNNHVVDPTLLPQGTSVAMALLADGGDYNDSLMYAGIHSETLLGAEPVNVVSIGEDGSVLFDSRRLFGFLGTEPASPRRKRSVFSVEGEPPAKFYRTQAKAREAASGREGAAVRKHGPTGHMVARSIGDLVRSVVYWLHGGTDNSSDFGMLDGVYAGLAGSLGDLELETTAERLRELS